MSLKLLPSLNPPGGALRLAPQVLRRGGRVCSQFDVDPLRTEPDPRGSRSQRRAASRRRRATA